MCSMFTKSQTALLLFLYIYFNTEENNQFNNVHLPDADRKTQMWSA